MENTNTPEYTTGEHSTIEKPINVNEEQSGGQLARPPCSADMVDRYISSIQQEYDRWNLFREQAMDRQQFTLVARYGDVCDALKTAISQARKILLPDGIQPPSTLIVKPYDSTEDTKKHIGRVQWLIDRCRDNLRRRQDAHDKSKLEDPEKAIFDDMTPKLKDSTYGSDEYKEFLSQMKPALDHHYAHNSHHPEHYPNGIDGMSLLDLLEMLCDWKAAGERHANGSIERSLEINRDRFKVLPQLQSVLENTARELGWLNDESIHPESKPQDHE